MIRIIFSDFSLFFAVLPKDGPKITGGKDRYSVGDTVNVNCTSKASKPAADIQWIINGKEVKVVIYNLIGQKKLKSI